MNIKIILLPCIALALGLTSCNQKKELTPQQLKARQDSIAKATRDSIQLKMRNDSIAKVKADSLALAKKLAEFDIAKIYKACRYFTVKGKDPAQKLIAMGFKKGPSFQESMPPSYTDIYYKNCKIDGNGNATELLNTGTPVVLKIGASNFDPDGRIGVEVFDKDCLKLATQYLKQRDKGNPNGLNSYEETKTKLGWYVKVDYPGE